MRLAHRRVSLRMPECLPVLPRWAGKTCIVAATGPSLTREAAALCAGVRTIAVNDAFKVLPWAEVLYACDAAWWRQHEGCRNFSGERWSSHGTEGGTNDKFQVARLYELRLVAGRSDEGFSSKPTHINYGGNSGFQAVNLAILFGATRIVLVGFDMRCVEDKRHFFGDHPRPLRNSGPFNVWTRKFSQAAKRMPPGVEIVNATPNSAIRCFSMVDLEGFTLREAA